MLRGKGSNGWFGPRVLWLIFGTAVGLIAPGAGLILAPLLFLSMLTMATFTDRLEWKNMLHYMNLLRAVANGRPEKAGIIIEEVDSAEER